MASSKPTPCGPCQEGKVNSKADIWCYNCEEGLCSACSGQHKQFRGTHDHKTIDIKSYKPSIQTIKTECDKHGQQLNLYCPSHLMPCCDECTSTSHSKCTEIKSLATVVEKAEIEETKESVENDINSILHLLDKMVNNKSKNIKTGEQQCKYIKKSIRKIREKKNKNLDHLEKELCEETDKLLDQEKSTAKDFLTEIKKKKTYLKETHDHLLNVTTHSSNLQSFLGLHQIEQQIHQCQRYVEDLEKDERAKEFDIKITKKGDIKNILQQLGSLESIEVTVVKTETNLNIGTTVRRKAQVDSIRVQCNINNMTMNIETKIEINLERNISDMICLMDRRFIVVEQLGKVNLLTSDGKLQKQLPIPGRAWSVTQINQDTIAITYPQEKAIKIFNMENETVTKVITLDKECRGLSFFNNSLGVGFDSLEFVDSDSDSDSDDDDGGDEKIRIIDLEGNTLKSIHVESESDLEYLVYCKDRIIYSDYYGDAVYCYDKSGEQIWRYEQDLEGPRGLCIDTYGNIIVADYRSGRIIVISKDGQNNKVLIGEEDGLEEHQCICFKHNESAGFICDYNGSYLTKFNLVVR